jgi:molybdopterin-guanine dinucleotide biosynthesis protein A
MQADSAISTLAILAGGESKRMGRPKAELFIAGEPILSYLLRRFAWPGPTMLVTAPGRQHPPRAEGFDKEVVDPVPGQGPLRGVLTALENATTPAVIIATVDMPAITAAQLLWLESQLSACPQAIALMITVGNRLESFPSIFRAGAIDVIRARLAAADRSMHQLATADGIELVPAAREWGDTVWTNLNTPDDLAGFGFLR